MKKHPILFSAPMVRAILAGTKTQTRRVVKYDIRGPSEPMDTWDWYDKKGKWAGAHGRGFPFKKTNAALLCPYGQPGDRLWVRETWQHHEGGNVYDAAGCVADSFDPETVYKASSPNYPGPWRPSIHMPRWASRITLGVTGLRVEKLRDISEADCGAEGCSGGHGSIPGYQYAATPLEQYNWLWNSINGAGSWDANPWVWVIEFKRVWDSAA